MSHYNQYSNSNITPSHKTGIQLTISPTLPLANNENPPS